MPVFDHLLQGFCGIARVYEISRMVCHRMILTHISRDRGERIHTTHTHTDATDDAAASYVLFHIMWYNPLVKGINVFASIRRKMICMKVKDWNLV